MLRELLEDLRVADREALAAEGLLENVLADAVLWLRTSGNKQREGEIRGSDIDEALQMLDLALARADGALARLGRSIPARDFPDPAGLGYRWPLAARTADRAYVGQLRIHHDREWLRARFAELSAELQAEIEPLSTLEPPEQRNQRQLAAISQAVFRARAYVVGTVLVFAAIGSSILVANGMLP